MVSLRKAFECLDAAEREAVRKLWRIDSQLRYASRNKNVRRGCVRAQKVGKVKRAKC
jgi:hypothetical protein